MPKFRSACAPGCNHPGHMMYAGFCAPVGGPEPQNNEISSADESTSAGEEEKSQEPVVQTDSTEKMEKQGKKVPRKDEPSSSSSSSDTSSSSTSTSTSSSSTSTSSSSSSSVKPKPTMQNAKKDSKKPPASQKPEQLQSPTVPGVRLIQASAAALPAALTSLPPKQDTQPKDFYPSYGQARILSGVLLVALVILMLVVYFIKRGSTKKIARKSKLEMSSVLVALTLGYMWFISYLWTQLRPPLNTASAAPVSSSSNKPERITNFLQVPLQLERFLVLGLLVCLDSFLHVFTILPLRFIFGRNRKKDFITISLILIISGLLSCLDASRLYHNIRAQSTVKLYVLFNVGEVMDKLLSSFGLDVFDALFGEPGIFHYALALIYTFIHALVLLYQVITLNVAANTQNNAILTLLVSNQFMEVKSAVFKKFDRENLFQLACADAVERFILVVFGAIIALRNWSEFGFAAVSVPEVWERVLMPLLMLLGSEIIVDVLKHAFITKFNAIPAHVYSLYAESIAGDLSSKSGSDQSPSVARKLGFSLLPLCCLVLALMIKRFSLLNFAQFFVISLLIKCILGSALTSRPHLKTATSDSSKVE